MYKIIGIMTDHTNYEFSGKFTTAAEAAAVVGVLNDIFLDPELNEKKVMCFLITAQKGGGNE